MKVSQVNCLPKCGRIGTGLFIPQDERIAFVRSSGVDPDDILSARTFLEMKALPSEIKRIISECCRSPQMIRWVRIKMPG